MKGLVKKTLLFDSNSRKNLFILYYFLYFNIRAFQAVVTAPPPHASCLREDEIYTVRMCLLFFSPNHIQWVHSADLSVKMPN